jgi:glycosyltransferase involved in cell wall biosynthesis
METFGIVILEAFYLKTPVIVSDVGGIPEIVKDNINGLLFNNNDEQDLLKKLSINRE